MKKLEKFNKLVEKLLKQDVLVAVVSDFLDWFSKKLKIHFLNKQNKLIPKKWDIFYVNLWKNIWSELNKSRPCIVYSIKISNFWNTVLIIPLKSYKWYINDFQLIIEATKYNNLQKKSIVDISSIRQVDKKRLLNKIWKIEKNYIKEIDNKILFIFWIKKQEE